MNRLVHSNEHKYFITYNILERSKIECPKKDKHNVHVDGNKSLYLVFVGVVFLSILDCF
jgi:hypothetical protein